MECHGCDGNCIPEETISQPNGRQPRGIHYKCRKVDPKLSVEEFVSPEKDYFTITRFNTSLEWGWLTPLHVVRKYRLNEN